jgi:hypothetical protein
MANAEFGNVVKQITDRHKAWFNYFRLWNKVYWIFGILSATCSALAAADKVVGHTAPGFAVFSSICIAILAFTNPQRRANGYVAAWRVLGSALLTYETGESSISELIAAVDRGEAIIGGVDTKDSHDPPPSQGRRPTRQAPAAGSETVETPSRRGAEVAASPQPQPSDKVPDP